MLMIATDVKLLDVHSVSDFSDFVLMNFSVRLKVSYTTTFVIPWCCNETFYVFSSVVLCS